MFSSRDSVLQTTELLQEILLQLDMRTLLTTAQLVSRQWHELITSSPALKQTLYFDPLVRPSGSITQNPLLAEAFPLWFPSKTEDGRMMVRREDFGGLPMAQASRRHAFMHPSATWRRMLVQQPPVLRLGRWVASHTMMGDSNRFLLEDFPDGLRMGSLYDLAQDWACQTVSGFSVFWDPSSVTENERTRYDRSTKPEKKNEELRSFASQAGIILFCYMVAQCTSEWPNIEFEEAFTFAPSKEQRDRWDLWAGEVRSLGDFN